MTSPYIFNDLKLEEGLRTTAYPDPLSPLAVAVREGKPTAGLSGAPWTIGYGHTGTEVHPGVVWTPAQCDAALDADIKAAGAALDSHLSWWRSLSDLRQDCLLDMTFNMGVHGLLGFNAFLAFVRNGSYVAAADDLAKTKWAGQVLRRANRIIAQMRTGQHQSV